MVASRGGSGRGELRDPGPKEQGPKSRRVARGGSVAFQPGAAVKEPAGGKGMPSSRNPGEEGLGGGAGGRGSTGHGGEESSVCGCPSLQRPPSPLGVRHYRYWLEWEDEGDRDLRKVTGTGPKSKDQDCLLARALVTAQPARSRAGCPKLSVLGQPPIVSEDQIRWLP